LGSITLPASGDVYVDANVVIYMVEAHPTYYPLLEPVWKSSQTGAFRVVTSALTILESLVGPLKKSDAAMTAAFNALFSSADLTTLPIDEQVLREAAGLRAKHSGLRTPDAIHAATAIMHSAHLFITNDPAFRRVVGLNVTVLSDLIP